MLGREIWLFHLFLQNLLFHAHLIELEGIVDVLFGNLSELCVRNLAITVAV